jgi:hypothetical protein
MRGNNLPLLMIGSRSMNIIFNCRIMEVRFSIKLLIRRGGKPVGGVLPRSSMLKCKSPTSLRRLYIFWKVWSHYIKLPISILLYSEQLGSFWVDLDIAKVDTEGRFQSGVKETWRIYGSTLDKIRTKRPKGVPNSPRLQLATQASQTARSINS